MDGFREFNQKADVERRLLTRSDRIIVATRLDKAERPAGYDENRYSLQAVKKEISMVDMLLNLPQNRLKLTDPERYQLRLLQNRDNSHMLLNDKKFGGDSTRMGLIKDDLAKLESFLAEAGKEINAERLAEAESLYDAALLKCQDYIDNKNPWFSKGKERLRMVKETKLRLSEERKYLSAARQMQAKTKDIFSLDACVRDVLLKGQRNIDSSKAASKELIPEKLTWEDYASMVTQDLTGSVTFSDKGLKIAESDAETIENRKVKEQFLEVIKTRIGKDKITKDMELRIRKRLGIDSSAFESGPMSKESLKDIFEMVSEDASLVTSILSKEEPQEAEKPEDNSPAVHYALAKAVNRYIVTKEDEAAISRDTQQTRKGLGENLMSIVLAAREIGENIPPLTKEQLEKLAIFDLGKLRDEVFNQMEDIYNMAVVVSGGNYSLYKNLAVNDEIVIKLSARIISKAATQSEALSNLVKDTELALFK